MCVQKNLGHSNNKTAAAKKSVIMHALSAYCEECVHASGMLSHKKSVVKRVAKKNLKDFPLLITRKHFLLAL